MPSSVMFEFSHSHHDRVLWCQGWNINVIRELFKKYYKKRVVWIKRWTFWRLNRGSLLWARKSRLRSFCLWISWSSLFSVDFNALRRAFDHQHSTSLDSSDDKHLIGLKNPWLELHALAEPVKQHRRHLPIQPGSGGFYSRMHMCKIRF